MFKQFLGLIQIMHDEKVYVLISTTRQYTFNSLNAANV